LNKASFLKERRRDWERFENLLRRAEVVGRLRLTTPDVTELSELYRAICYDLTQVRSRDWGSSLELYLNDLVVRGHGAFYSARPRPKGQVLRFFASGFPRLLRENYVFFWTAFSLFTVPLVAAWVAVAAEPSRAQRVLPGTSLHMMEQMYAQDIDPEDRQDAAMAGFYVNHNTSIAFQCFALGFFLGIGTIYVLLSNGIQLGTVAGYVIAQGHGERFLSFVVSHSSFELTAIVVSGTAGLILGHAVVAPGALSRREALKRRGRVAVELALGAAAMLFIAALIEGFWSAQPLEPMVKYVAAALLWIVVIGYLGFAGRSEASA
jgi:uncharacterized membrane protein SpoIIM required for sporulation